MKNYKKAILPLLFVSIISATCYVNGSQQENSLELLLFSAAKSLNPGHLGIYYDPKYPLQKNAMSTAELENFRDKQKDTKNIIDYAAHSRAFKMPVGEIGSVADREHLFTLLQATDIDKRGLVLYYTHTNEDKNYVDEIKEIRKIGWSLVVICHQLKVAQDIDKAFFADNNKSKSIVLRPKDLFYRNALLISAFGIVFMLCHKYFYR